MVSVELTSTIVFGFALAAISTVCTTFHGSNASPCYVQFNTFPCLCRVTSYPVINAAGSEYAAATTQSCLRWNAKPEGAAFTFFAFESYMSSMLLNDSLADRQPQTGASLRSGVLPLNLFVLVKNR